MAFGYNIVKIGNAQVDISLTQAEIDIIKAKTPVDTGDLRDGFVLDGLGGIINLVFYGIFVELGTGVYYKGELGPPLRPGWTRGFPGRYMVEQSMEEMTDNIIHRVLKDLDLRKVLDIPDEIIIDLSGKDYETYKSPIPHTASLTG